MSERAASPSRLVQVGFYTDVFDETVHLYRDVLGFRVLSESATSIRLDAGSVEMVLMRSEQTAGRFPPGAQLVVEVDRRDGEFVEALHSAKRAGVSAMFDGSDGREYTDVRGPNGEYLLISQPEKPRP